MHDHPASVELRRLDWDTDFFGPLMGKIDRLRAADTELLVHDLGLVLAHAQREGYAHLIFRTDGEDLPAAWAAARTGMRLVDVGIDSTFTFGRSALPDVPPTPRVRNAAPADLPTLRELAAAAFTLSRFSADPFFSAEQVQDFHRKWITNLCNGLAQAVLVCEVAGRPAGFVSCAMNGDEGRIPLIATDAAHRRAGLSRPRPITTRRWGCITAPDSRLATPN
jgi:dTDP-4-amino-4,6-dideoxy-D-galactose acyltransferase